MEKLTKDKLCEILDIKDLRGPFVDVMKCVEIASQYLNRLGEKTMYERRGFFFEQFKKVGKVVIVPKEDGY